MVWPQIPRTDAPHTGATAALASLAYRNGPLSDLTDTDESTNHKPGRHNLFSPTLGEAFCRAVMKRTLPSGRKPLVPSFGTDARLVVEHCVAATALRRERDKRLTLIGFLTGFLFLPGTLIWLAAVEIRRRTKDDRAGSVYGGLAMGVAVLLAAWFAWRPPFGNGYLATYVRVMMLFPVGGWAFAHRYCQRTTAELRERWNAVLDGSGVGPIVNDAVPFGPEDSRAEVLRKSLDSVTEEQYTNVLHYAGTLGILGMGRRWGVWNMAEQLEPREGATEIRPFHPWDVVRKIEDRLNQLSRSSMANSGLPHMTVQHWAVQAIGEKDDEISRPGGADRMDGPKMRPAALTDLANRQVIGNGPRHYLGAQFVLWDGQLVVNLLINVKLMAETLQIEVAGHALGPMAALLSRKAKPAERSVPKPVRFWETRTVNPPEVSTDEVVRLTLRAPFTWPWAQTFLDWLGGTLALPEPFGLRHAWANKTWSHHFMSDDARGLAIPVMRAVHKAVVQVLDDHDVDTERFKSRSQLLGSEVQGARPSKVDQFDM